MMVGCSALMAVLPASDSVKFKSGSALSLPTCVGRQTTSTAERAKGQLWLLTSSFCVPEHGEFLPMYRTVCHGDDGGDRLRTKLAAGTQSAACDTLLSGHECQRQAPACWPATLQP